jgi:dCMP deaminase
MARLPWPEYFLNITRLVAERSTCSRRKVGALAIKDRRILATGYNGAPRGLRDCLEIGCLREELGIPSGQRHELCRGLHAEQNVIIQAAVYGVSLEGAEIYCTHQPCLICAKMLINCGVKAVRYASAYPDPRSEDMFAEAGIILTSFASPTDAPSPDQDRAAG